MNYPNGIKKTNEILNNQHVSYKNRGMNLEKMLDDSNMYYIETKKAYIYKKPTPIRLVKVDYKNKKIEEAYFEKPSTTDYNGIYKGKYIDFEAKETNQLKSFPIRNIHNHQIEHIKNIFNEGGICFLIVRFTKLNKNYLLMAKDLLNYLNNNKNSNIPLTYFEEKGYLIKDKFIPSIDYLEVIENIGGIYEKEKWKRKI